MGRPWNTVPTETAPVAQALRVEYLTLGWNTVEAVVALVGGVVAASVALTAFGIDSGIELISAAVVPP